MQLGVGEVDLRLLQHLHGLHHFGLGRRELALDLRFPGLHLAEPGLGFPESCAGDIGLLRHAGAVFQELLLARVFFLCAVEFRLFLAQQIGDGLLQLHADRLGFGLGAPDLRLRFPDTQEVAIVVDRADGRARLEDLTVVAEYAAHDILARFANEIDSARHPVTDHLLFPGLDRPGDQRVEPRIGEFEIHEGDRTRKRLCRFVRVLLFTTHSRSPEGTEQRQRPKSSGLECHRHHPHRQAPAGRRLQIQGRRHAAAIGVAPRQVVNRWQIANPIADSLPPLLAFLACPMWPWPRPGSNIGNAPAIEL